MIDTLDLDTQLGRTAFETLRQLLQRDPGARAELLKGYQDAFDAGVAACPDDPVIGGRLAADLYLMEQQRRANIREILGG